MLLSLAGGAGGAPNLQSTVFTYGAMILLFVAMYFFMIRPQKKREREAAEMRNAIEVGDEIITLGGIVGTVVSLREDTLLMETGSDRNKIRILRSAVSTNNSAVERVASKKSDQKKTA